MLAAIWNITSSNVTLKSYL